MDKGLKIYELIVNEEDETGVSAIALVDKPAIERDWMAFSKQNNYKFEVIDTKKRIISGYFMLADTPIYRYTEDLGEFMVTFSPKTIETIVNKHFRTGKSSSFNLMHNQNDEAADVFLIESLIIDDKRGVKAPAQFGDAPNGSWWGSARVLNDEIWQQVLDGTFKGFSVEGDFMLSTNPVEDEFTNTEVFNAALDILSDIYLTEYVDNGVKMCGEVTAKSLAEAEDLAAQFAKDKGVKNCVVIGTLIDRIDAI